MTQFFCKKPGGWTKADAGGEVSIRLFEGTRDKGPWYDTGKFSPNQVKDWLDDGVIELM